MTPVREKEQRVDPTSPPVELLSVEEVARWNHANECAKTGWSKIRDGSLATDIPNSLINPCTCGLDAHRAFLATLSEARPEDPHA